MTAAWADGRWSKTTRLGAYDDYSQTRLALAGDGVTGVAMWRSDGAVVEARLERTAKVRAVTVKSKRVSRKKIKARITWSAPEYAVSYRVKLSRPAPKKYRTWKTREREKYTATLKRGKTYTVSIRAATREGWGPAREVKFRT